MRLLLISCCMFGLACQDTRTTGTDAATLEAGTTVDATTTSDGLPPTADGASADAAQSGSCDPANVSCKSLPLACPLGQARLVVGDCWGECVPIARCTDLPAHPNCNISGVACRAAQPSCPAGYVVTDSGAGCWGPCVPVTTCACTPNGPKEQCPSPLAPACHANRMQCGPLD
ncbi:MAG: hypothetical protein H6707_07455 [Deltaproteobacteria bacterium]|nr:hypothetical protein [Deltaproteobacteria bacterium]